MLTVVAASIATGVSAQGMWRFSGDVLGLDGPLRLLLFAFIEVAIVTSAVRARRNMRENFSAGIDGIAVWALTCLTAVLSSMDARSLAEAVFRLASPLVAAWLWERGMAIERHRIRGTGRINWRLTPERVLVWLGIAEASDRTAGEVDAQRRITRVALTTMKVRDLAESGASDRKQRKAKVAMRAAISKAVEHARLAVDGDRQRLMLDQIGALCSSDDLAAMRAVAPWKALDHPANEPPAKAGSLPPAADELARALDQWSRDYRQRGPEVAADGDQSRDQDATTPATTGAPVIPAPRTRLLIDPGDPRPVGHRVPFQVWTRPQPRPLSQGVVPPLLVAEVDAKPDADDQVDAPGNGDGRDQDGDQKEPTEQDKGRIARLWARRVEAGEVLSKWELAKRTRFKPTWCGDRIGEGKQILAAKGWTFDERSRPVKPIEVDADLVASTPSENARVGA
ncbi:hypothetical protein ACFXJ8_25885 [Nonomuraea sp. NPDC059194]|uniref:hypothetical protein n=1 Tax=Nonomuraea sp. NPDC059194 TaxID=3346764 RepID=UPI0036B801B9